MTICSPPRGDYRSDRLTTGSAARRALDLIPITAVFAVNRYGSYPTRCRPSRPVIAEMISQLHLHTSLQHVLIIRLINPSDPSRPTPVISASANSASIRSGSNKCAIRSAAAYAGRSPAASCSATGPVCEIGVASMKLVPREARAGMKPAEASLIAAWWSAAPRILSVRTYSRPDWGAAASRSARYSAIPVAQRRGRRTIGDARNTAVRRVSHSSFGDRGRDAELGFLRGMQLAGRSDRASYGGRCYTSSWSIMPLGTRDILDDSRKRCARPEARLRA
jgi:hypothetical protein